MSTLGRATDIEPGLRPNADTHVLEHHCAGDYAGIEHFFDDTPTGARSDSSVISVSADAVRGVLRRTGDSRGRRSRRTAPARRLAEARPPSRPHARFARRAPSATGLRRANRLAGRTRRRRLDRTRYDARSTKSALSAGTAGARQRPPGRRERRRGRSAGPRSPRAGRRPRA